MNPIDELRTALARYDDWPTAEVRAAVIDASRRLIRAIDMRAEVIEHYRRTVTPSEQAMAELLGGER